MRVINVGVLRQKNIKLRLERPAKFKQDTCMHAPLMAKNVLHAFVNFYILVYNQNRAFFILTTTLIFYDPDIFRDILGHLDVGGGIHPLQP